jgi:PAS domain S-box-containing protein
MPPDRGEATPIVPEGREIAQIRQAELERFRARLYNERLSIAMRIAKAGAWTWDLRTREIFWTPEFEVLFDYELGSTQKLYSEWRDRLHPDDRDWVETTWQDAIDRKLPEYRCEYRIVWRDGQVRWIDVVSELHPDKQGEPILMSGLVYDITDRKQNEEALRRSEEFTRRILESNQDCIKVLDLEGRLLYMNDGGQALMEIDDFATIANTQWLALWQGGEAESALAAFTAAKAHEVGKFEGFCPTAKGTPKWWEVVVTPILDAQGNVEQILSVSRDITERKQSELALQASEELFRNTFEHTPLGFAHVALDGTLLKVNRKFAEIVGYSQEELLTTTFQAITEPADLDADLALVAKLLTGELSEYTLEKRYIHQQGHHVWVNLTASVVRAIGEDGQLGAPQYFLAAIKDISQRKQLELLNHQQTEHLQRLNNSLILTQQRLQERNAELDRFVYIASHDLKAPLRAIANLSEWIEEDLGEKIPAENQEQLQLMRERVKRMDALIDGLLRYSRLGRQELEIETVDVAQLVAETIDSLSPPASFQIEIIPPMPILPAKRLLLSQVFANLISNAIKHHDRSNGRIEITTEDLGDRYRFSIADDGPGIPPGDDRERIFEIFQTLQPSSSTENTGIGLALVKKIVEAEGGEIWLDQDFAPGCRFCFTWLKGLLV